MQSIRVLFFLCFTAAAPAFAQAPASAPDTTTHSVQSVTVDKDVKLEVLDWGGKGRPLVLLAGLGASAHAFDDIAPELARKYHVYGITRRGTGASDKPDPATARYDADRLTQDVLEALDALKLQKPVIAGHSIAGQELSGIAEKMPGRVAGLVYLEAGYAYAHYVPGGTAPLGSNLIIAASDLRRKLERFRAAPGSLDMTPLIADMQATLADFEKDLAAASPVAELSGPLPLGPDSPQSRIAFAVMNGARKFGPSPVPMLAIYATTAIPETAPPKARALAESQNAATLVQADAFAQAHPKARIVRLANASHAVWRSNRADVLREMTAFLDGLPR